MSGHEERLVRTLLARAVEDLPPGNVPAETPLVAGERVVRRRRLAAASVAAVTVVALLGLSALLGVRSATTPADGEGMPTARDFTPARRLFRLDWLPEGLSDRTYSAQHGRHWLTALATDGGDRRGITRVSRGVSVQVGAPGVDLFQDPQLQTVPSGPPSAEALSSLVAPGSPVADVRGAPAYLDLSGDAARLSWRYAPGGWATITSSKLPQPAENLRRIAEGLVWDVRPFTAPFLPVSPPAGAEIDRAVVAWWEGRWEAVQVGYRARGSSTRHEDLTVGVLRDTVGDTGRTTVDGRPAWVAAAAGDIGAYRVGQVPGVCSTCTAQVTALTRAGGAALGGRDGALALAARVRLVDAPDDEAAWRPL
ncbi:hypothetical protein [Micromonospora coxensis]|uniref:Uncharacterized protein n=1 Tax=Micromonospora coxensis TaxID=356852 RepID=A0A1C5JNG2_9ACTN|nr:hypothetical protein [Micromonospora coxensis]SCG72134.1 hypothetical protein GA0070614_4946 [Micromonospora coxensis]